MRNKLGVFLFHIIISNYMMGQYFELAKAYIDTLSSEYMAGRGYINDGHLKAATYIENEFAYYGLKQFNDSYFQYFTISVNTFPDTLSVYLNSVKSIPGKDFIVSPDCPVVNDTFKLIELDLAKIQTEKDACRFKAKDLLKKFIVVEVGSELNVQQQILIEDIKQGNIEVGGVIYKVDKLTWSVATTVSDFPEIYFSNKYFPDSANQMVINIKSEYKPDLQTQNVIGFVEGSLYPDSFIIISAHYDHLGKMGADTYFPGANDNASGVALMLNLAQHYSEYKNQPDYSIVFMAFGAEEAGLLGSEYYTENPLFPLSQIKFMLNTDLAGTGEEGIMVVNGKVFQKEFRLLDSLNNSKQLLTVVKKRGKAMNSDHYHFTERNVRSFFIYTLGGIDAYHDIYDRPETLPLTEHDDLITLLLDFIETL